MESDNWRSPLLMSASERFRIGFCFQVAVGALTGAKLAVVDGADILVGENRTILFDTAKDAVRKGLLDQVIITASATVTQKSDDPLIRVYHLPAVGRIEVVGG